MERIPLGRNGIVAIVVPGHVEFPTLRVAFPKTKKIEASIIARSVCAPAAISGDDVDYYRILGTVNDGNEKIILLQPE